MPSAAAAVVVDARYLCEMTGDCLGEWISDGTVLIADPTLDVRPLDLVAITIRDGDGPWPRYLRDVGSALGFSKVFLRWVGEGDGRCALVGQVYPPAVCLVPEADIEAMHRVVGSVGGELQMTARDTEALRLIAPFATA